MSAMSQKTFVRLPEPLAELVENPDLKAIMRAGATLSDEELDKLRKVEVPAFISGSSVDRVYFNEDTTRRILTEVMGKGLKIEGDKLGKTIIFAQNHDHAVFIEKQFNILFPQYHGKFAAVIDHKVKYHEDLL